MRQAIIVLCGLALLMLTAGGEINTRGVQEDIQSKQGQVTGQVREIIVRPGDSLWTLARQEGDPRKPTGRKVFAIQRFNHLDTSVIYPGQILKLPENI